MREQMVTVAVALFAEHSFEGIKRLGSLSAARAYADGFACGGGCYGAGSCRGYVMPEEQSEMIENEQESALALAALTGAEVR